MIVDWEYDSILSVNGCFFMAMDILSTHAVEMNQSAESREAHRRIKIPEQARA
jgi:hypothetical protein